MTWGALRGVSGANAGGEEVGSCTWGPQGAGASPPAGTYWPPLSGWEPEEKVAEVVKPGRVALEAWWELKELAAGASRWGDAAGRTT